MWDTIGHYGLGALISALAAFVVWLLIAGIAAQNDLDWIRRVARWSLPVVFVTTFVILLMR